MPKFFREHGRKEPKDRRGTISACSQGRPGATVWELTANDPAKTQVFMQAMQVIDAGYPFAGACPLDWVVGPGGDPARKQVVDVGGSSGHALLGIAREVPGLDLARCVLQDLPEVIERVRLAANEKLAGVELMPMDFHKEQPVRGSLLPPPPPPFFRLPVHSPLPVCPRICRPRPRC